MSDPTPTDSSQQDPVDPPQGGDEPETFGKEYVEKLRRESAKYRTEAKAGADATKRLAEIEESSKTEAQRASDELAAARQDAFDARSEALRFRIAAECGMPESDADVFLTGKDEDTMRQQGRRYVELTAQQNQPRAPHPDPNQGRVSTSPSSTAEQFAQTIESALNR